MSINIQVNNIVKRYGGVTVIPDLSLDIGKGEFFTLLGPSGCGKTTLLRMIAGFNSIEEGDIYFNEARINDVEPAKRKIGMVFQNYAIFPHLSVRKNIEFGLKNQKATRTEIAERAQEYIELVQIERWADQMPDRLSGGQQQRVALARALVTSPDVLLMDEPLSNLDAKLRVDMREAIREIQQRVGTTTVYVTHDQEEAMAVSDRIAVMKDGLVQQLGTPRELYHRPSNEFVSNFIGRTSILGGELTRYEEHAVLHLSGASIDVPALKGRVSAAAPVKVSVRPEQFIIDLQDPAGIRARVEHSTFLGLNTHYTLTLDGGKQVEAVQESDLEDTLAPGSEVFLQVKHDKINIFDESGEVNLRSDVTAAAPTVGAAS